MLTLMCRSKYVHARTCIHVYVYNFKYVIKGHVCVGCIYLNMCRNEFVNVEYVCAHECKCMSAYIRACVSKCRNVHMSMCVDVHMQAHAYRYVRT